MAAIELSGWQRFGGASSTGLQPYEQTCPSLPNSSSAVFRYNTDYGGGYGYRRFGGGWAQDFPRAGLDCLLALRRLTRIDSPSPLNVVDTDDDHMWDYPGIYAVGSNWAFTDAEAQRLRNFIACGGFLMVDHFHGRDDWNRFMSGMSMVLPEAVVADIPDGHHLDDISEKFQIPGEQYVATVRTYEKDGYTPGWRRIRD
jgi:Domain of unknown function (DUF4159)